MSLYPSPRNYTNPRFFPRDKAILTAYTLGFYNHPTGLLCTAPSAERPLPPLGLCTGLLTVPNFMKITQATFDLLHENRWRD
jgi:hypothetical protein